MEKQTTQFAEIIFPDGSTVRAYPVPDTKSDIIFILSEADKAKAAKTIVPKGGLNTNEAIKTSEVR